MGDAVFEVNGSQDGEWPIPFGKASVKQEGSCH